MIASDIAVEHDHRHIPKILGLTRLGPAWTGTSDEVSVVVGRLEQLAGRLTDLPCRRCFGRTDAQPVSFTVELSELPAGLGTYVGAAVACGGVAGDGWAGLFRFDVLQRVDETLEDAGDSFPKCVAFLMAAVAQASLAGWSQAIDHALVTGQFDGLVPDGACGCPARRPSAPLG